MSLINYLIIIVLILSIYLIIGMLWKFIQRFFHNNYSFFDVSFIIGYFLEQFTLILLLEYQPNKIAIWVSLFALIVVTTASLQKLTMDSKDRKVRELYAIANHLKEETEELNEELLKENQELKNAQRNIINYFEKKIERLKK